MNSRQKVLIICVLVILGALIAHAVIVAMNQEKEEGLKVVATFYPLAYFAKEIGGEQVTVSCLVPENSEVHSWQPSTSDILAVDEADIVVYNGAGLDHWFEEDILPAIDKSNKIIVETTEGIELLETEDEHDHGSTDPHTWISPYIAKHQAQMIFEAIVKNDPDNEDHYIERWNVTKARLQMLDADYMDSLSNKSKDAIFVTHSAFGYLANRYGFEQHGLIGLAADEQPSTKAIVDLVDLMKDHETYVVYVDPIYSDDYAQTLKSELEAQTDHTVKILKLYFMLGPMDGMDYFEQCEANLDSLEIGLEAY